VIRINLLPQKRQAPQEQSQTWVAVIMGVLFVQAIGLFFFHQTKTNELARQRQVNGELQTQIAEIQKTVANHAQVKAQLAVIRQREEAINKLTSARSGPTQIMLELARVLTTGRGPTIDADRLQQLKKDNPLAVPNPGWDARRLWLSAFHEGDRTVTIEGLARDGEDVSEMARRLSLSNFFSDVKLLPANKTMVDKVEMLKFQLQAKVKYLWPPRPRKLRRAWPGSRSPRRSAWASVSSSWSPSRTSSWGTARCRARSPPRASRRRRSGTSWRTRGRANLRTSRIWPSSPRSSSDSAS
jgi:type IV pilus assembly protein PilN